jgi:YggT family protein
MQQRGVIVQERRVERTEVGDPPPAGYADTRRTTTAEPYREVEYERVVQPNAAAVDQVEATAYDPYAERRRSSYKLVQGIWLLFGIVTGLLAIRFILKLLGANESAGFANFIYAASGPFIAPFNNLFGNPATGGSVMELNTLVAIIVYMLVAWLVAKVVWLLAGENRSATRTVSNATRARVR